METESNSKTDIERKEYLEYIELATKNINKKIFDFIPRFHKKLFITNTKNDETKRVLDNLKKICDYKLVTKGEYLYDFLYKKSQSNFVLEVDQCSICTDNIYDINFDQPISNEIFKENFEVIILEKCKNHYFHLECLGTLVKNYIKCPVCGIIYGEMTGDMPDGKMIGRIMDQSCDGYQCPTIQIIYEFNNFTRNNIKYTGTTRYCYLPLTVEGIEVCSLLIECFKRKLTFTVGTSLTTGQKNTTIWNGIHHKTNLSGGPQYFGFPDSTYFIRITQEIASKGITNNGIDVYSSVESFLNIKLIK